MYSYSTTEKHGKRWQYTSEGARSIDPYRGPRLPEEKKYIPFVRPAPAWVGVTTELTPSISIQQINSAIHGWTNQIIFGVAIFMSILLGLAGLLVILM